MSSKHTPGPWKISRSAPLKIISNTEHGGIVAESSAWWYSTDQAIINARLIAAAPETLQSLESLMEWCEINSIYPEGWDKARAAIAKAKGETQ